MPKPTKSPLDIANMFGKAAHQKAAKSAAPQEPDEDDAPEAGTKKKPSGGQFGAMKAKKAAANK